MKARNSVLEKEIAERTKELREKVKKLDRGRKAMLYIIEDLNRTYKELKSAHEKIVRSERLATIGRMAGIVSHEMRNPLSVIRNSVYFLEMKMGGTGDEKIRKHLRILDFEVKKADKIISDILDFARIKPPSLEKTDINMLVKESLKKASLPEDVCAQTCFEDALPVLLLDILQIKQVFLNIISNSVQAMSNKKELEVKTALTGEFVSISFKDTGCGIPKENLNKIFEPLFSTKAKGIGLGLTACRGIVEGHKGEIMVESEPENGTMFIVKLPLSLDISETLV